MCFCHSIFLFFFSFSVKSALCHLALMGEGAAAEERVTGNTVNFVKCQVCEILSLVKAGKKRNMFVYAGEQTDDTCTRTTFKSLNSVLCSSCLSVCVVGRKRLSGDIFDFACSAKKRRKC